MSYVRAIIRTPDGFEVDVIDPVLRTYAEDTTLFLCHSGHEYGYDLAGGNTIELIVVEGEP